MGIHGLETFIKTHVRSARTAVQYPTGTGTGTKQTWGIDCSCILYRAKGANLSSTTVLAGLVYHLRRSGVEPIVVFDGQAPSSKAGTIERRRIVRQKAHAEMASIQTALDTLDTSDDRITLEKRHDVLQRRAPRVTGDDRDEIKQYLHGAGVRFITASHEADDVLAYFCRMGTLDAVVSTDTDLLARGVPRLIVPDVDDATVLSEISLATLLAAPAVRLTYSQFVAACVLMGTDFGGGKTCKRLTPVEAIARVRSGAFGSPDVVNNSPEAKILLGIDETWETLASPGQREKWATRYGGAGSWVPVLESDTLASFAQRFGWPPNWCKFN